MASFDEPLSPHFLFFIQESHRKTRFIKVIFIGLADKLCDFKAMA